MGAKGSSFRWKGDKCFVVSNSEPGKCFYLSLEVQGVRNKKKNKTKLSYPSRGCKKCPQDTSRSLLRQTGKGNIWTKCCISCSIGRGKRVASESQSARSGEWLGVLSESRAEVTDRLGHCGILRDTQFLDWAWQKFKKGSSGSPQRRGE